ncbi:MAG TPA: hypothetical protein VIG49_12150, partial [Acetobacteraceae bacterium]
MTVPEIGYIVGALLMAALFVFLCLLLASLRRLRSGDGQQGLMARVEAAERLLRDDNQTLRSRLLDLDQGLRKEVSVSTRDGFERAFDKVQEGSKAQSQAMQESMGRLQSAMSDLSERVTTGMTEMK